MTFPVILDVAIGLAFIFLTFSAIASSINEFIAILIKSRAKYLQSGILDLLCENETAIGEAALGASSIASYVLKHPLIRRLGSSYAQFPSYIPADTFVTTLLDGLRKRDPMRADGFHARDPEHRLAYFKEAVNKITNKDTLAAMQTALSTKDAEQALSDARTALSKVSDRAIRERLLAKLNELQASPPVEQLQALRDEVSKVTDKKIVEPLSDALKTKNAKQALEDVRLAIMALPDPATRSQIADFFNAVEVKEIKDGILALPNSQLRQVLLALVNDTETQVQRLEDLHTRLEKWFNDGMDRVSVLYKRNAQRWLLAIGLVVSVMFNADALSMLNTLWRDPTLRGVLVAQAASSTAANIANPPTGGANSGTLANDLQQQQKDIKELLNNLGSLPIGWDCNQLQLVFREGATVTALGSNKASGFCSEVKNGQGVGGLQPTDSTPNIAVCTDKAGCALSGGGVSASNLILKLVGILLMAAAISFGAPFWYGVINKLVPIRPDKPKS